jgi:hypothetical protein
MLIFLGHTAYICGVVTSSRADFGHLGLPPGLIWGNTQNMLSCTVFLSNDGLAAMPPSPLMIVSLVRAFLQSPQL